MFVVHRGGCDTGAGAGRGLGTGLGLDLGPGLGHFNNNIINPPTVNPPLDPSNSQQWCNGMSELGEEITKTRCEKKER